MRWGSERKKEKQTRDETEKEKRHEDRPIENELFKKRQEE